MGIPTANDMGPVPDRSRSDRDTEVAPTAKPGLTAHTGLCHPTRKTGDAAALAVHTVTSPLEGESTARYPSLAAKRAPKSCEQRVEGMQARLRVN